jgi:uncharacterized protein (TIGR03067 family)
MAMSRLLAIVVVLILPVAVVLADDKEDAKKELRRLTGTWKGVSAIIDGKELPKEEAETMRLVVKGESYTFDTGKYKVEGTHQVNPRLEPKTLDAVRNSGPDKGETLRGIYALTDDTFRVCFAAVGKKRPGKFESEPGSGNRLMVFRRTGGGP